MMRKYIKQRLFTKAFPLLILCLALLIVPGAALADEVNGHIFLQGTYIEVGISPNGRFGSSETAPAGYHENSGGLGFVADYQKDGWTNGTPAYGGDYFYPGAEYEGFGVEWTVSGSESSFDNTHTSFEIITTSLSETSSGNNLIAEWEGTATDGSAQLTVRQTYWFNVDEAVIHAVAEIENTGSVSLDSVEFMRGVDPDNEQPWTGNFDTSNEAVYQPGVGGNSDLAIVTATATTYTDMSLVLGTVDARARVSASESFSINTDSVLDAPTLGPITGDYAIGLAYRFGTLAPGDTVEFSYVYGLNLADVDAALGSSLTSEPTAITENASGVTQSGAQLNGTVNPKDDSTSVVFEYGLDTSYGNLITADQSPVAGTDNVSVSASLSGLSSETAYHYRVVATNSAGTTQGLDQTFTTSAQGEPILPETGFTPGQITRLPQQPPEKTYSKLSGLTLEIPAIDVQADLIGIPKTGSSWDVTWLGNQAGYLAGTAFPTLPGNTVITGHVWGADNLPGIFVDLKQLSYGDEVRIHAWGQVYSYQVQESRLISPYVPGLVLEHKDSDWLTLLTCEDYAAFWEGYGYRRVVQAVLVDVSPAE
jgi:LPXTG-site transpeptidase (sortase) family protein